MSKQFLAPFFFFFFPREINAGENASVIKSPPIHLVVPPQSCVRLQSNIDLPNIFERITRIEITTGLRAARKCVASTD